MQRTSKTDSIAIDASRAFVHERTGIEEYAYQLIKYLRVPLREKSVVLYVRLHGEAAIDPHTWIEEHFFTVPRKWRVHVIGWRRLWTQGGLAWRMFRDRPRMLLVPAHTVPWIHPHHTVVVIHGLEYEMTPQAYSPWARIYMRRSIRASCRWASQIITVSKNTQQDVTRLYGVEKSKMTIVYEGVNEQTAIKERKERKEIKEKPQKNRFEAYKERQYFFFVGRIEERKNITRIVQAFDLFKEKTGFQHQLILAGGKGYMYSDVEYAIKKAQYRDDILMLGFVSDAEKWFLLRHACVFVFPTLYEGFGLPVLEAQSMGVPVITSMISSLPEVAGESALLVDPYDVDEIADAMRQIASDKTKRRDIIARGFQNITRFSWKKCAEEIAELL